MRSRDLNRLLDEPGPGADRLEGPEQIYVFVFPVEKPNEGNGPHEGTGVKLIFLHGQYEINSTAVPITQAPASAAHPSHVPIRRDMCHNLQHWAGHENNPPIPVTVHLV